MVFNLFIWLVPSLSYAEEDEGTIGLFSAWQDQVASPTRVPKPLSQIAENVTVITASEIKALNAHSLADILDTVPGFQLQHNGGPGVPPFTFIHSADFTHVQVLLDGVSITNLGSNFSDITSIPAQIIERVEIVKGASSTAWGQALGGVVNVTTKGPDKRLIGGSATASIGERSTADTRAELSGTSGKLGYYLSGGYLGTNGLLPGRQAYTNQAYAKLTYNLPDKGQLWGTFGYTRADLGIRYVPQADLRQTMDVRTTIASLGLRMPLSDRLELELTGSHFFLDGRTRYTNISDGMAWQPVENTFSRDEVNGVGVKLVWRDGDHLLVTGGDFNHLDSSNNTPDGGWTLDPYKRVANRWDLYLNDTITAGSLSVSPGVRFDHTDTSGDNFSASLGATWQLTETTLLRAYTGRGNGLPVLGVTDQPTVKIWNSQLGVESSVIPYLWVKGTLFRNETWDLQDALNLDSTIPERRIALGAEVEARTAPVYNTSLGVGYTFTDTRRASDDSQVQPDTARHTLQLSLRYDDKTFRGVLNGRHINWNSPADYNGKYGSLIWDLHLGATLLKRENSSMELFFSGHNLFDSAYYYRDFFPTTGRWFEGGLRVNF